MNFYMRDKILKIINTYGVLPQLKYLQSEVFEFNEAVIKYNEALSSADTTEVRLKYLKEHIAEEFADVQVMLEQFKVYYNLDNQEIMEIMEYKINRQIDRIEKGDDSE